MAKKIGIIYNQKIARAKALSEQLLQTLPSQGASGWACSSDQDEDKKEELPGIDFIVSIGGDGTLIHVSRLVARYSKPIVGVNTGSLGFMAELSADDVVDRLAALLRGEGWIDERAMLQANLFRGGEREASYCCKHILNDVVISRGITPRLIHVKVSVDGSPLTVYKADGTILCTATGSTAYNLAQGGPILHPQAKEVVLNSIAPHLSLNYPLVLPPEAVIDLEIHTEHEAMLSLDGQINFSVKDGDRVRVSLSPDLTRLLRIYPPSHFYTSLEQRLRRSG